MELNLPSPNMGGAEAIPTSAEWLEGRFGGTSLRTATFTIADSKTDIEDLNAISAVMTCFSKRSRTAANSVSRLLGLTPASLGTLARCGKSDCSISVL